MAQFNVSAQDNTVYAVKYWETQLAALAEQVIKHNPAVFSQATPDVVKESLRLAAEQAVANFAHLLVHAGQCAALEFAGCAIFVRRLTPVSNRSENGYATPRCNIDDYYYSAEADFKVDFLIDPEMLFPEV